MALGKREEARQQEFWTPTACLSTGPGHVLKPRRRVSASTPRRKSIKDLRDLVRTDRNQHIKMAGSSSNHSIVFYGLSPCRPLRKLRQQAVVPA